MHDPDDKLLFKEELGDELLFKDEPSGERGERIGQPAPAANKEQEAWKILIVDDEEDVHSVTTYMIRTMRYLDKGLSFLHAYSGGEARDILAQETDIAVILLDVVMETDDSGLRLVRFIREDLGNDATRIILRTGQPGKAPATKVIVEYDINDYKEKTDLTLEQMLITITSALRSYNMITALERNRSGLKKVIEASHGIFERQTLESLGGNVLTWFNAILRIREGFLHGSLVAGKLYSGSRKPPVVLAATGSLSNWLNYALDEISDASVQATLSELQHGDQGFICRDGIFARYFKSRTGAENFLYLKTAEQLGENEYDLLKLFFTNVSLAFDNLLLNQSMDETQKEVIFHIAEAMEYRSQETGSHVRRVAEYAKLLALKYGLGEEEAEMIKLASTPHDLGKISIPDAILNKPGRLTPEEYTIIRTHVYQGYNLLVNAPSPIIQAAAQIILLHHERWDGQGYPHGLKGEDIHIHGRIVGVADVFDALSNNRVYHDAWSWEDVFAYFEKERGKHFDPQLVDILLDCKEEFKAIWLKYNVVEELF